MIGKYCGHHCGLKDGLEGHCPCIQCHNGMVFLEESGERDSTYTDREILSQPTPSTSTD